MSLPKGPASLLIAAHFKRRPTTHWSEKETRVMRRLATKEHRFDDNCEELKLVLRYQEFERKKGEKGIHRRDLYTFLNNYLGELDRARAWAEKHPMRPEFGRTGKAQPARWEEFLDTEYLGASNRDFWSAPGDVQREYRTWEKL